MAEFRYDIFVLALTTEFWNYGVRHGSMFQYISTIYFFEFSNRRRLEAKIGIMFTALMTIQKKQYKRAM